MKGSSWIPWFEILIAIGIVLLVVDLIYLIVLSL